MLILLPPSETKAPGGNQEPLDFSKLILPELNTVRQQIAQDLQRLDVDTALEVLGISEKLRSEAQANTTLFTQATMPAILRYTGVLYEALDASTLTAEQRSHLAVGSALFGIVGANDLIPHYRLSASTKLPDASGNTPTLKRRWGKVITQSLQALADAGEFIVDLRSGGYQQLGPLAGSPSLRVESLRPDGTRKVISHNNKLYKGKVTSALLRSEHRPRNITECASALEDLGFTVELPAPDAKKLELTLVVEV